MGIDESWGVDGLCITSSTANLRLCVEFDNGVGKWVSICSEVGHESEHGTVEGAVDLC